MPNLVIGDPDHDRVTELLRKRFGVPFRFHQSFHTSQQLYGRDCHDDLIVATYRSDFAPDCYVVFYLDGSGWAMNVCPWDRDRIKNPGFALSQLVAMGR